MYSPGAPERCGADEWGFLRCGPAVLALGDPVFPLAAEDLPVEVADGCPSGLLAAPFPDAGPLPAVRWNEI